MKSMILVLTIIFSISTSTVNSQTVTNKEKKFPEELKTKWYYQFVEELQLTPQDYSEFGNFFINGTLVSQNTSGKVYINGIAILNNSRIVNSKFGKFEVYYFSVFKAKTDYEIFFEKVEFWEVDQNEMMTVSRTVNSLEGHYYTQYYQSDYDVLCTEELYITSEYEEMLKVYRIE
jgi:hypothetical protein